MNLEAMSLSEYQDLTKKLSRYCWRFNERHKKLPTFRQIANRFKLSYDDIEILAQDCENVDIIEGGRVGGLGGGIYTYETRGEYLLECYENPETCPA